MLTTIDQDYLEARDRLVAIDWDQTARRMGCTPTDNSLALTFFGETHHVNKEGCFTADGRAATTAVGLALCRYVLRFPTTPPWEDQRITFRELTDSGPLVSRFADNTLKIITTTFAHGMDELLAAAARLSGRMAVAGSGFDLFPFNFLLPAKRGQSIFFPWRTISPSMR